MTINFNSAFHRILLSLSVCKPEIQPAASLILSLLDIPIPFLLRHGVPDLLPSPILEHIVCFRGKEQHDRQNINRYQIGIAPAVFWLIVISVYEESSDISCLHRHLYAQSAFDRLQVQTWPLTL